MKIIGDHDKNLNLDFEYDFIDDNNNDNFSWSSVYLDLQKISFFDIFIKKLKLNKRKNYD